MQNHMIIMNKNALWAIIEREDGRTIIRAQTKEAYHDGMGDNKNCGHCHVVKMFPTAVIDENVIVAPEGVGVEEVFNAFKQSLQEHGIKYVGI